MWTITELVSSRILRYFWGYCINRHRFVVPQHVILGPTKRYPEIHWLIIILPTPPHSAGCIPCSETPKSSQMGMDEYLLIPFLGG